jgi:hypothetical protein
MIELHNKHDNVPQSWYEITKGKLENPFFVLRFSQDCESKMVSGKRNIKTVSGEGCLMDLFNAKDMHLNWINGGINFIRPSYSDSVPVPYGSYVDQQ